MRIAHERRNGQGVFESVLELRTDCEVVEVALEGVEDFAALSGSAGAAHAAPSRGSRRAVDGPDGALTIP